MKLTAVQLTSRFVSIADINSSDTKKYVRLRSKKKYADSAVIFLTDKLSISLIFTGSSVNTVHVTVL